MMAYTLPNEVDLYLTGIVEAKMIPHHFEAFKENKRYKTIINNYATQSWSFLGYTFEAKSMLQTLLEDIEKELNRLSV